MTTDRTTLLQAVIDNLKVAKDAANPRFKLMVAYTSVYRNVMVEDARNGNTTDDFWWNLASTMENGLQAFGEVAVRDFCIFALEDAEIRLKTVQKAA